MTPQRIQLRRTKGYRKPEGAVVVARPSKWGNPYTLEDAREYLTEGFFAECRTVREICVGLFRRDLLSGGVQTIWVEHGQQFMNITPESVRVRGRENGRLIPARQKDIRETRYSRKPVAGMTVTDLAELANTIQTEISETLRIPALDAARAIANEVGLRRARGAVADGPDLIAASQDAYRNAQATERQTREAFDGAVIESEWELDSAFHADANRVYLRIECDECRGSGKIEGSAAACRRCDGVGSARKSMTADERKAWKAAEARKLPTVRAAEGNLRRAEEATAAARDGIEVARTRVSAARHELEAAIAELGVLSLSLGSTRKGATP